MPATTSGARRRSGRTRVPPAQRPSYVEELCEDEFGSPEDRDRDDDVGDDEGR